MKPTNESTICLLRGFVSETQSVQRCRKQSDTRYGVVHRLDQSGSHTDCGQKIATGNWWVLGPDDIYPVTCRSCRRDE